MTGDQDQAQQVVADLLLVQHGLQVGRAVGLLLDLQLTPKLLLLLFEALAAAEVVQGSVLGRAPEPGARLVGDA